jgi:hypothetical protein
MELWQSFSHVKEKLYYFYLLFEMYFIIEKGLDPSSIVFQMLSWNLACTPSLNMLKSLGRMIICVCSWFIYHKVLKIKWPQCFS